MHHKNSHRRYNPLTGKWILVSPHRVQRPWQGKVEDNLLSDRKPYEPDCYLCPGNVRASGANNPKYSSTFVFRNDFSALTSEHEIIASGNSKFLLEQPESGICKVVCFSPRHDLTLAEMNIEEITQVVKIWKEEYITLGSNPLINYVTIFENKGELMGCSNPHPHGQIWAQHSIPEEPALEQQRQLAYFSENHETLLSGYLAEELQLQERIVAENNSFVLLVPFWAVWPFETMILPKSPVASLSGFDEPLTVDFADMIRVATAKYDNIFHSLFPYSSGIHQAPTDGKEHPEWHMHMHFYPPLLRSATVKKFMVGYELIAEPQRDITAESSAAILRGASTEHFNRR